ncbi:MAG TPA: ATP-dependent DNA helicase RecG, partial [Candidatus Binatia bacterium]|nr:ATP-dependent DNA helicase RecG [Candidatus Binatia bacterium]
MPPAAQLDLTSSVDRLHGVGLERKAQLARLGISTIGDLLLHRPRRYEDRRHMFSIFSLSQGHARTVRGRVIALGTTYFRRRQKSVFELIIDDGTARLHCRWWNLPFMEKYFQKDDEVFVFGRISSVKPRTMDHPETEVIEAGEDQSIHINRIAPIYPLTEGLPQRWVRGLIWRTLGLFEGRLNEPWPEVPPGFIPLKQAMHDLHFPEEIGEEENARKRLALDEFIQLQLAIQRRRRNLESQSRALPCGGDNRLMRPFLRQLEFGPTGAQTRVLREIRSDLSGAVPMRRLLQGDVGSGKTFVAGCAALMAIESGFTVALMAPTEILAEQHFQTFSEWFKKLDVPVLLRTGARKPRMLGQGASLIIGTHALIEENATLPKLGLVVIDEQHKFGVAQREKLVRKGNYPHLLVMTATPIPRTLGLTLYGDLDVSVIDELPAGRGKIETFIRAADKLPKVWEFVKEKLSAGRQAFVVYPRVEETDGGNIKAVLEEAGRLQQLLAPFRIGVLHGRLKPAEKELVMSSFRNGKTAVLVASSIVEVGVNVPNASVMVIENAEQFGLAQLHQLRGRIGRGSHASYCILIAGKKTPEVRERLTILAETNDG